MTSGYDDRTLGFGVALFFSGLFGLAIWALAIALVLWLSF
jgi:type IV secretory pathway TrbD component